MDFDHVTAYSGVGIASIVFPAKQIIFDFVLCIESDIR